MDRRLFLSSLVTALSVPAMRSARADNGLLQLGQSLLNQQLGTPTAQGALSDSDITAGLKQALGNGVRAAINDLGRTDGFWGNARFRIPLPGPVQQVATVLQSTGMGGQLDALHLSFNRAAEQAVPLAADVFAEAVQKLSLEDVRGILNGPQDSATQYFRRATSDTLTTRFRPVVAKVTSKLGLVQQYNQLTASAGPMMSMLGVQTDLDGYVTAKALDGLYGRVGDEEKAIRTNPAARTSDILKKVFGSH